jgi:tRNA-dihydrouridine synthase B
LTKAGEGEAALTAWRAVRIGDVVIDPPVVQAPMAGVTSVPARMLARRAGAGAVWTEMVSAEALTREPEREAGKLVLSRAEHPVAVQLFGADAARLADAAAMAEAAGADLVDLNLGCPMAPVVNAGAGVALAAQPQRAGECVRAMARAVSVPVTVKMRAGARAGDESYLALARRLVDEGAAAVTLHGRTAAQAFRGDADWTTVARLVEALAAPVIGNGDVRTAEDALRRIAETGCAAVMIGSGAMGNPWLFGEIAAAMAGADPAAMREPSADERLTVALWHAQMLVLEHGERDGLLEARRQLLPYLKGMAGSKGRRAEMSRAESLEEIAEAILSYHRFSGAQV